MLHDVWCTFHPALPQFAPSVQRPHATQAAASCCAVRCGVARLSAYCGYTVADRAVQGPHGAAANGRAQARQAEEGRPARPSWRRARDPWRLVPPQPSRTGYHVVRDTGRPPGATGCARLCTVRCRGSAMLCVLHVVCCISYVASCMSHDMTGSKGKSRSTHGPHSGAACTSRRRSSGSGERACFLPPSHRSTVEYSPTQSTLPLCLRLPYLGFTRLCRRGARLLCSALHHSSRRVPLHLACRTPSDAPLSHESSTSARSTRPPRRCSTKWRVRPDGPSQPSHICAGPSRIYPPCKRRCPMCHRAGLARAYRS